tara:strand:- start:210 stop:518 length:309 start_codon:yes stop_codon:yes gene_type:complete
MRRTLFSPERLKSNRLRTKFFFKKIIHLLTEYLSEPPIGQTDNFIWLATPIGIAAVCKTENKTIKPPYDQAVKEGLEVAIDLSREEKEFHETKKGLVLLFYS